MAVGKTRKARADRRRKRRLASVTHDLTELQWDALKAAWGDALVAFAWQCVLGLITGIAAATGKDARGNLLVPVELAVSARGIQILPMARHRFSGSSTLKAPK